MSFSAQIDAAPHVVLARKIGLRNGSSRNGQTISCRVTPVALFLFNVLFHPGGKRVIQHLKALSRVAYIMCPSRIILRSPVRG